MAISEQLQRIAENQQKVYDAGKFAILNESEYMNPTVSGSVIAVNDVNAMEHKLGVKVTSKNLMVKTPVMKNTVDTFANCFFLPKGTYTISMEISNATNWRFIYSLYTTDGELVSETSTNTTHLTASNNMYYHASSSTYRMSSNGTQTEQTITTDDDYYISINFGAGDTTSSSKSSNVQLELGSTATEYTPYITDFSGVEVSRYGKNLFDIGTKDDYEIVVTTVSISNESIIGTIADASASKVFKKTNYKSGKYAISVRGDNARILVQCFDSNGNVMTNTQITIGSGTYNSYYQGWYWQPNSVAIINIPDSVSYWRMGINFFGEVRNSYVADNIQIALGNSATEYEPYIEPQTATASADGTIKGLTSLSPNTTLISNTDGVITNCEYYRDIDTYIDNLTTNIALTGGN